MSDLVPPTDDGRPPGDAPPRGGQGGGGGQEGPPSAALRAEDGASASALPSRAKAVGLIVGGAALLLGTMLTIFVRARAAVNHEPLAAAPKPVTTVAARLDTYRSQRAYVGAVQPWAQARVGPQYVSAYVGTVLVRPGAVVRRGEVLATLDCRSSSAASQAIAARAKALEERRNALQHESERVKQMRQGGFASENELEQLTARTSAETAEVESLRASLLSKSLEVDDCILRAPFAGEVSDRHVDPGAYIRPGQPVVTLIDRTTVRVTADAPESDFAVVEPGREVKIVSSAGSDVAQAALVGKISRRAPAADDVTRTVHFEIDLPNPTRALPVGTSATIAIEVGEPEAAVIVPLRSATIRGERAVVFVVADGHARRQSLRVLGEHGGSVYLEPKLANRAAVVLEGRALLDDGDAVAAKEAQP